MDPFVVLGVDPFASDAEIVRAFRRLALLHHPDRNGGSTASAARFRDVKAAYDAVRGRLRAAAAAPSVYSSAVPHPGEHWRGLEPAAVGRVRMRIETLNDVIRAALADPNKPNVEAVIDAARWARLDVDSALALKGHVANLKDARWSELRFTSRHAALATLAAFVETKDPALNLVGMRNLRARVEGLLTVARGLASDLG